GGGRLARNVGGRQRGAARRLGPALRLEAGLLGRLPERVARGLLHLIEDAHDAAPTADLIAARWAGVVPQQPPTIVAPASRMPATCSAKSRGSERYTARMSTSSGMPAFDLATSRAPGTAARIFSITGMVPSGPLPQLPRPPPRSPPAP